jgi:outer membrane protein assembly factor BamE
MHDLPMRRFAVALCCFLAGCSWVPSWGVYKIDVNQGNYVTQDVIGRLKAGQSRSQVRLLLGTPLVADAFHGDRWDYVYRFESGGKLLEEHKFTVEFKDDKLEKWSDGDLPVSAIRGYVGERKEGVITTVPVDESGWWRKFRDFMGW